MLRGNKGEWSEIYVLLKLLADGKIYAADQELVRLEEIYYPIVKIIREEKKGKYNEYNIGKEIEIYINGNRLANIPSMKFKEEAELLLKEINSKKSKGVFEILETERFMNDIKCFKISAPSANKSDITMKILDINTGYSPTVGFSIKSKLGSSSTLLNAGKTTNFIFKVIHNNNNIITETNKIYNISGNKRSMDVIGRIHSLESQGAKLEYQGMKSEIFKDNLILIDSCMDKIIAETLLYFYSRRIIKCSEMVKELEEDNPMNYGNVHAYSYKFKKFLTSVALGMRPATRWDGIDEASGGYIFVTKSGDVLAYHIYNRNYFEEYLLNNTKYETASTSRHSFGELYEENGETYLNLNLQIRFT